MEKKPPLEKQKPPLEKRSSIGKRRRSSVESRVDPASSSSSSRELPPISRPAGKGPQFPRYPRGDGGNTIGSSSDTSEITPISGDDSTPSSNSSLSKILSARGTPSPVVSTPSSEGSSSKLGTLVDTKKQKTIGSRTPSGNLTSSSSSSSRSHRDSKNTPEFFGKTNVSTPRSGGSDQRSSSRKTHGETSGKRCGGSGSTTPSFKTSRGPTTRLSGSSPVSTSKSGGSAQKSHSSKTPGDTSASSTRGSAKKSHSSKTPGDTSASSTRGSAQKTHSSTTPGDTSASSTRGSASKSTSSKSKSDTSTQRSGDSVRSSGSSSAPSSSGSKEPIDKSNISRSGGNRAPSTKKSNTIKESEQRPRWNSSTTLKAPNIDHRNKKTFKTSSGAKGAEPREQDKVPKSKFTVSGKSSDTTDRSKSSSAGSSNNTTPVDPKCNLPLSSMTTKEGTAPPSASTSLEKDTTSTCIPTHDTMPSSTSTATHMSSIVSQSGSISLESSTVQYISDAVSPSISVLKEEIDVVPSSSTIPEERTDAVPSSSTIPEERTDAVPSSSTIPEEKTDAVLTSGSIAEQKRGAIPTSGPIHEEKTDVIPTSGAIPQKRRDSVPTSGPLPEEKLVPLSSGNSGLSIGAVLAGNMGSDIASGMGALTGDQMVAHRDTLEVAAPPNESTGIPSTSSNVHNTGTDAAFDSESFFISSSGGAKAKKPEHLQLSPGGKSVLVDRSMSSGTPPGSDESPPHCKEQICKLIGIVGSLETGRNTLAARLTSVCYREKVFRRDGEHLSVVVIPTSDGDPTDPLDLKSSYMHHLDAIILLFSLENSATLQALLHLWLPTIRKMRPNLPPMMLVGNKRDIVRDVLSDRLPEERRAKFVNRTVGERMMNHFRADRYEECSALTMEYVERVEFGLFRLVPDIYPDHRSTPLMSLLDGPCNIGILGDPGTGRHTLAARLCRKAITRNRRRYFPFKNVLHYYDGKCQFGLKVTVIPNCDERNDTNYRYAEWWMDDHVREMEIIIVLYAIDDPTSLVHAIQRWWKYTKDFNVHPRRVFIVGNKIDNRRDPYRIDLLDYDCVDSMAVDRNSKFFECAAFFKKGTRDIRETFIYDYVADWC